MTEAKQTTIQHATAKHEAEARGATTMTETQKQDQHRTIWVGRAYSNVSEETIATSTGWSKNQAEEMARWNLVEANGNDPEQHEGWEDVWNDEKMGVLVISAEAMDTPEATEEDDPLEATLAERMAMLAWYGMAVHEEDMLHLLRCVRQGDAGEIASMIRRDHTYTDDKEAEEAIAAIYAGGDAG